MRPKKKIEYQPNWERLEQGIAARKGHYTVDIVIDGKRIRRAAKPNTVEAARELLRQILNEHRKANAVRAAKTIFLNTEPDWRTYVEKLNSCGAIRKKYLDLRASAKKRNLDFSLSENQIVDLILLSNGKCDLTGISLEHGTSARHPFKLSFDRIDSSAGYRFDNMRVVCFCVNVAIGEWGEEVLAAMALGFSRQMLGKMENEVARKIKVDTQVVTR